jgi:FkbM family methyltransferase
MIKYSIVIPTYNHLEDCLKPCIESIIKHTSLEETEIIIVANGCVDDTYNYVVNIQKENSNIKLIWFENSIGFTKATNEGIKKSTGEYVILLNNDCVLLESPKNQWINNLNEPFSDEKIMATGVHEVYSPELKASFIIGYCLMVRKWFFSNFGLLDEIFSPGYGEDTDLCLRIVKNGFKFVSLDKDSKGTFPIYHKGEATFHENGKIKKEYENIVQRNTLLLENRYSNRKLKLNIGSGYLPLDGYLGLDLYNETADIKSDVVNIPFDENSIEEIVSYHVLEHIFPDKVEEAIKEWYKLLMPGGKLVIELPNTLAICEDFPKVEYGEKFALLYYMYCNPQLPGHAHVYGWWPESIHNMLYNFGFREITFKQPQTHLDAEKYCMRVEAIAEKKQEKIEEKKDINVNVIIPTYKRYNLLRNALESVLNQTYKNVNAIIIADGKDDFVEKIVNEFKWKNKDISFNYHYIEHEGNIGSKPRIYGIEQLDDEGYVCFLDDDNIMYSDYVEKMVKSIQDKEVDIPMCKIYFEDQNRYIPGVEDIIIKHGDIDSLNVMVPNKIAKTCKDKWMHVPGEKVTHDFDFIMSCVELGKIKFISTVLGEHRNTPDNYIENDTNLKTGYDFLFKKMFSEDRLIYEEIFKVNSYNYKEGELKNEVVLDIGANKGYFSIFATYHGAKKVYAYEPDKKNFDKLVENTKNFPNIICLNKAIHHPDVKYCHTILNDVNYRVIESKSSLEGIECVSLESVLNEIDEDVVLKTDCEGSEYDILLPCSQETLKRIKIVYSEFHDNMHPNPDFNIEMLKQFMVENGFKLQENPKSNFTAGMWMPDGSFLPTTPIDINENCKFVRVKSLQDLGIKYNTDKATFHRYCNFYDEHLMKIKDEKINLLEIGIHLGQSLSMWKEYFKNGMIYAIDIFDNSHLDDDRIKTDICDQTDINKIADLYRNVDFSLIVDDGSHETEHQIISFSNLFKKLNNGGIYILEDLHTSNIPAYRNWMSYETSTLYLLEEFQKTGKFYSEFLTDEENLYLSNNIEFVEFFRNNMDESITSVIRKKENNETTLEQFKKEDLFIYQEIFEWNSYMCSDDELNDATIIDLGANVGMFSVYASLHGAKVIYAFEPNKVNFKKLVDFTKDFPNIICINKAVHKPGMKKVFSEGEKGTSTVKEGYDENSVDCVTLEEVLDEVKGEKLILKIDVEGAEYDILYNCPTEKMSRFETIYAEFHDGENGRKEDLSFFIGTIGYQKIPSHVKMSIYTKDEKGNEVFIGTKNDVETLKFIKK